MVAFNGNNVYLTINGISVCPFFAEMELERSVDTEDVTAGCGVTDMQRAPKLRDRSGKLKIVYDAGRVHEYIAELGEDTAFIVYGPEGNVAGKPKHAQKFILEKVSGPGQSNDKKKVVFDISLKQADAPQDDMYAGAVFA